MEFQYIQRMMFIFHSQWTSLFAVGSLLHSFTCNNNCWLFTIFLYTLPFLFSARSGNSISATLLAAFRFIMFNVLVRSIRTSNVVVARMNQRSDVENITARHRIATMQMLFFLVSLMVLLLLSLLFHRFNAHLKDLIASFGLSWCQLLLCTLHTI